MARNIDMRVVLKHVVDGDIADQLCRVCLLPLSQAFENIFTAVYKGDSKFSVAHVLKNMCKIEVSEIDNFNVCKDCFFAAAAAYEFKQISKRSTEIIDYYISQLEGTLKSNPANSETNQLYFELPQFNNDLVVFDFKGCFKPYQDGVDEIEQDFSELAIKSEPSILQKTEEVILTETSEYSAVDTDNGDEMLPNDSDHTDEMLLVVTDNKKPCYYEIRDDKIIYPRKNKPTKSKKCKEHSKCKTKKSKKYVIDSDEIEKVRKKRAPMPYNACSECPIKYRFLKKLKKHMLKEHGITLYICKICKLRSDSEKEMNKHMKTHNNVNVCNLCDAVFRKADSLKVHLDFHKRTLELQTSGKAHVCEQCGIILLGDEELYEHCEKKHQKKYSCHYCGRLYKCQISIIKHLKKHEEVKKNSHKTEKAVGKPSTSSENSISPTCEKCGRHFVDERALQWHSMLHTNERPFKCDVCMRGFISANRRNQHALTAHTAPTRKCPLCPAVFHLRSIVNTHIKKVHLKKNKRRTRRSKYENVSWQTVTVPIPDLAVDIQNEIIEMKSHQLFEFGK